MINGQKIKIPMLGHAADVFTSVPGDLLLTVDVSPHDVFTVEKKNIKSKVELSLVEAILGCKITVSTAYGPANLTIPAGVCTGSSFVIKHMGMPEFDPPEDQDQTSLRGDHIVTIEVVLGEEKDAAIKLKREQLLREFLEIETRNKDKFYSYYDNLRKATK